MVAVGDFVKVVYHGRDIPVRSKTGDIIDIKRDDESPYTLRWDNKPYLCEIGKSTFVPFEAIANALGDPRSGPNVANLRDVSGNNFFVNDRATEVRRLRTLYDNQLGSEGEILYAPEMDVEDLEGASIQTVLNDPEGDSVTPVETTLLDRDTLLAQLARQQRMIETLAQAQNIDLNDPEASHEPAPEPTADPFAELPEDK
jgi:hypothetical protein